MTDYHSPKLVADVRLPDVSSAREDALEEARMRAFGAAVDSLGDAFIAVDHDGLIRDMNRTAEQLTGWTSDAARARALASVFQTRPVNAQRHSRADADRSSDRATLVSREGREYVIEQSRRPIVDVDGAVRGEFLVFRTVGASTESPVATQRNEARFRILVEGVKDYAMFL